MHPTKLCSLALSVCFFFCATCSAQVVAPTIDTTVKTVIVKKDPRFDELAAKQAELNKKALQIIPQRRRGWRIQVANTQNRDEANTVKVEMLRRFPDQKTYLIYYSPNYRVKVGNFLTQKDAMPLRKMISKLYPDKGIYIVQDDIEYTLPADEEEKELEKEK